MISSHSCRTASASPRLTAAPFSVLLTPSASISAEGNGTSSTGSSRAGKTPPLAHPSEDAALLHGDFHPGNMVFTTPTGALSGLWDFSCVERGDPSGDLRYLVGDSAPLTVEIIQSYEAMTGRSIDLVGARLVRVLEEISDAVEERRSLEPVLHALESLKSHLTRL
jgi:hypothetical protein